MPFQQLQPLQQIQLKGGPRLSAHAAALLKPRNKVHSCTHLHKLSLYTGANSLQDKKFNSLEMKDLQSHVMGEITRDFGLEDDVEDTIDYPVEVGRRIKSLRMAMVLAIPRQDHGIIRAAIRGMRRANNLSCKGGLRLRAHLETFKNSIYSFQFRPEQIVISATADLVRTCQLDTAKSEVRLEINVHRQNYTSSRNNFYHGHILDLRTANNCPGMLLFSEFAAPLSETSTTLIISELQGTSGFY